MDKERLDPNNIIITELYENDIVGLEEILSRHVRSRETGELIVGEVEDIKNYMRGGVDSFGRTRRYLVAKDLSGKILGCMAYSTPEPAMIAHFNLDQSEDSIELLNAFVSAEVFRGGGVGSKLFQAVCEAGRNAGKQWLLVHSGPRYQDSWGFYDRVCDEQCGFIENKYGEGLNAKTWKKNL